MIVKVAHIVKLIPIFLLLVAHSLFSQTQNNELDSFESRLDNLEGKHRIEFIASFIRGANLATINHVQLKSYLKEAYLWEKENPNPKLLNTLRLAKVNVLIAEVKQIEAIECLLEIVESGEVMPQKDSISTYNFLVEMYSGAGAYSNAWEALSIRDKVINNVPVSDPMYIEYNEWVKNDLALLLFRTKQYIKAIEAFKELIIYSKKIDDIHGEAGAYNNLGLVYLKIKKPDSAVWAFNESKVRWKEYLKQEGKLDHMGDLVFLNLLDGNIAAAYNQKQLYHKAIPLLKAELEAYDKHNDSLAMFGTLNELSISYIGLQQYSKAISLLDSAIQITGIEQFPNRLRMNYAIKIKALEGDNNTKEAYQMHKKLVAFNDSMTKVENSKQLAVMQVIYNVEKKNRELSAQKNRLQKAEEKAEKERENIQTLIAGVLLMLLVIIMLVVSGIQRRKRADKLTEQNKLIEHQKEIIERALEEKETLLKEIHHRVKNNLQLISGILELQAVQFDDQNVKTMMAEGQSRVRSMSLIHQQLYQSDDLGKIDFREYLNKLTKDIAIAFNDPNKDIEFEIKVKHLTLDINTAVPLGLIVNELVANAYKHAFKGRKKGCITVDFVPVENEEVQLWIKDNGIGLPEDFDPHSKKTLGLRLVQGLTKQLDGEYYYESEGGGTQFVLQFKNKIFK